ncbi:hypothetical protein [Methylomonas sp. MK1]|uniref:hypothetical protein n=1 Tax=Methylomonas sp. MK1 TaxID=1131552 RepID=UPI00037AC2E5|nr:hypothetical protein [Methylomonas sp. MK1]
MSETHISTHSILPRFIRIRDAPFYLGMDKNRFNTEVRPSLTEIKIGQQGIAFDRIELDAWADEYVRRFGKSSMKKQDKQEKSSWQRKSQVSSKEANFGTLIKSSKAKDVFASVLEQTISRKPKTSSRKS